MCGLYQAIDGRVIGFGQEQREMLINYIQGTLKEGVINLQENLPYIGRVQI
jgi:hypothetical protein